MNLRSILFIVFLLSYLEQGQTYETETHFDVTYVLARSAGFDDGAAKVIAVGTQKIDDTALTSPMYFSWARLMFHFSGLPVVSDVNHHGGSSLISGLVRESFKFFGADFKFKQFIATATYDHSIPHYLMTDALKRGDIIAAAKAIHSSQDNLGAHVGFSSGTGHLEFAHATDDSAENPYGFENMVYGVLGRMIQMRKLARAEDLDLEGSLRFLNQGLEPNEYLQLEDLDHSSKIASALLKKQDFQRAYITQIKMTQEYKSLALKRIIKTYASLGAVNNEEAIWSAIPKNLLIDPSVSVREVLLSLLLASESSGGFLKYIDPQTKEERDILNLDKALAGNNKKGMSVDKFLKKIEMESYSVFGFLEELEDIYRGYLTSKVNLNQTIQSAMDRAKSIQTKLSRDPNNSRLVLKILDIVSYESSHATDGDSSLAHDRLLAHSNLKQEIYSILRGMNSHSTSESGEYIQTIEDSVNLLMKELSNFVADREVYFRSRIKLDNALRRVHISKSDFILEDQINPEMAKKLSDPTWKKAKAKRVAEFNATSQLVDRILESFVPLEFNDQRHVVFENDGSLNRKLLIEIKKELWRSFVTLHFGTNIAYRKKVISEEEARNELYKGFESKLGRDEFQKISFEDLMDQLGEENDKRIISEMGRRTAERILGYSVIQPKEHAQKLGFNKESERSFNWHTIKLFIEAGLGYSRRMKEWVAMAEATGRDYLYLSEEEIKKQFPQLDQNPAALSQINSYENLEENYQKMRKEHLISSVCSVLFK